MSFINNMKIGNRLYILVGGIVLFSFLVFSFYINNFVSDTLHGVYDESITEYLDSYQKMIDLEVEGKKGRIEVGINLASTYLKSMGTIFESANETVSINGNSVNKWTLNGKQVQQNYDIVDSIKGMGITTSTIFQKVPQGYLRVSTNVMNLEGKRAEGTLLGYDSPVVQSIEKGERFIGRAWVVDKWFITAYEPIRINGIIKGMIYVGVPDVNYNSLSDYFSKKSFFGSGYPYIVDSKGIVTAHAVASTVGKSIADYDFFKEMTQSKNGVVTYDWEGREKTQYYRYQESIDSYVTVGWYTEDYNSIFNTLRFVLIISTVVSLFIVLLVLFIIVRSVVKGINSSLNIAEKVSIGNLDITIDTDQKDEIGQLANAMKKMVNSVKALSTDANMLSQAALQGKLDTRADATKHQGDFRAIIQGVNDTLDNVIGPLNVAAEYVDRISKGDIPPKITDNYNGDFNEIKNNLNGCIDAIDLLVKDAKMLSTAALEGKLDTRADATRHGGDFRAIVQGVNDTLDNVIGPLNVAAEYVDRISKGDIPPKITDNYNGDFNEIKNNLNGCIDAVDLLVADAKMLATAAIDGKLDTRADATRHGGDFRAIVQGVNDTLDNVIGPLNVAAEYVDRISKGDIPPKITDNYNGDFNEIKNNLNGCIDSLNGLIDEMSLTTRLQKEGDIEAYANVDKYQGAYKELIFGYNEGMRIHIDAIFGMLNLLLEYSEGNLVHEMPVLPGKQIIATERINLLRQNIINLISDTKMLAQAALQGKLDVRADVTKHQGDFRAIVQGVNDTLDNVIGPLNVAAEYVDRISKGDIPEKITKEYYGDFNLIKNNLNTCIDAVNLLVADAGMLSKAAVEGKLDTRADVTRHGGDFRAIVQGVNDTLDNVIGPLNVAAEYVDRIAKGDIPPKITDNYNGDFNEIKNNLNQCIDSLNGLINEMNYMSKQHDLGDIDVVINVDKFTGAYNEMAHGVNDMVNGHISVKKKAMACFKEFGNGNLDAKIEVFPGKKVFINETIEKVRENIKELVKDANMLANAAIDGKLDTRADATKHNGDFRSIIDGVNKTLDNVIGPLNVAAEYVDRISKGDIPPKITDNYNGDFNEIKNNLNGCIDAVDSLVKDALMLVEAAESGALQTRAEVTHHHGDFRKIVEGVNRTLDLVVEPIEETSNVMSIFATGDLTSRILSEYQGDFARLKNDINAFAESLSDLITQLSDSIQNTASAAHEISSTAESLAAASQEQSAQADEVANAVEAMSRTITENAMSASRTADVATKNSSMASESGKVVEQTVSKMKDIATVVKNSATNIEQLGESSKQIGEIISVIDDIADQTNLLALNAAIEAARAGEQGRGFAVVADEVRKLAERTTEATKQIAKMIKGIQHETEQAVIAMNKGTVEVQSGIELADLAGESLKQILTSTHEVLDMVNQIAAASEEQSATSEQISKNVIAISKVTADSTSRVEDVAKTSDELARMTEQLRDLISSFKVDDGRKGFSGSSSNMLGTNKGKQLTSAW
ncbi:MAG: Cache 3/Cache 2 fusion domain-containing protein [Candidatus Kapabacteria bacterium]|nr:Cache 3/Cache 2 fusion domain-containing protein [Ignavibacteriota bacterium]MCW5883753.1 Cache 3/Cache 2 fusion domain-containing protein [Candidatus Kapabacteria bacterium]